MKKFLILLGLLLFQMNVAAAQEFVATVNRNPVSEGETLVLTLDLRDVDSSATPDLNVLSKDFNVLSISNGYRTNIINGNVSKSRQWSLVMIPNRSGEIIIPEIELAGYKTQPIKLKVKTAEAVDVEPTTTASDINRPQFKISGEADNKNPYIQQQITYKLKIYDTGGLQGEAPIFMGSGDDWIIKPLDEPSVETKIINGKQLRVITFTYAMFPQKSGNLEIPAVKFNGYYLTKNRRVDPFADFFGDDDFFSGLGLNDIFARKNPVVLTTKPIAVKVKPAATVDGWWLPASKVEVSAEFDSPNPKFKVGEPVSRTIYVKAYGVTDNQMPELKFANVKGVKQYPEKPLTEMTVKNGQIITSMQTDNVYIPSESGEIWLPEVKVNWFNTNTNSPEVATIPAYKAMVVKGDGETELPKPQAEKTSIEAPQPLSTQVQEVTKVDNTMMIAMLLAAFVGGMILAWLLFKLFAGGGAGKSNHYKAVINAAHSGDIHKLRDELLWWGKDKYPSAGISNLQDVADVLQDEDFNQQTDKIREFLYSGNNAQWDGSEFVRIFKKAAAHKVKCQSNDDGALPKLYK